MPRSSQRKAFPVCKRSTTKRTIRSRRTTKRKTGSYKNRISKRSRTKSRKSPNRSRKVKGGMGYDESKIRNAISIDEKPTFDDLPLEVKDNILSQIVDSWDINNIEMKQLETLSNVFGVRGQRAESKIVNKLYKYYFPSSKYVEKTSITFKKYNLRLLSTYYTSLLQFLESPSDFDTVWILNAYLKYPRNLIAPTTIRICKLDSLEFPSLQVRIQYNPSYYANRDFNIHDAINRGANTEIVKPISDLHGIIDIIQSHLLLPSEYYGQSYGWAPTVIKYNIGTKKGLNHMYQNFYLNSPDIPFPYTR